MTLKTVDTADTESLTVDDLHRVEPRAAGLDVHKCASPPPYASTRPPPARRKPSSSSSAHCPTDCGR